jgi:hypothetical protein
LQAPNLRLLGLIHHSKTSFALLLLLFTFTRAPPPLDQLSITMRIDVEILFNAHWMSEGRAERSLTQKVPMRGSPRDLSRRKSGDQQSACQTIVKAED